MLHESQVRNVAQRIYRAQCHVTVSQGWAIPCDCSMPAIAFPFATWRIQALPELFLGEWVSDWRASLPEFLTPPFHIKFKNLFFFHISGEAEATRTFITLTTVTWVITLPFWSYAWAQPLSLSCTKPLYDFSSMTYRINTSPHTTSYAYPPLQIHPHQLFAFPSPLAVCFA